MTQHPTRIPPFLYAFPGAVLRLTAEGVVVDSNGALDRTLRRDVVGREFTALLDPASSLEKWQRVAESADSERGLRCELILGEGETLTDPLAFIVVREQGEGGLWVMQLPSDPRLEHLSNEVHTINSALNTTQRELSKEKRRLDSAMSELQERQIELARSNHDLQQFAHVISHDLKAPLRSVRSYAEFLRQDLRGTLPEEADGFLERIIVRAADMDSMINGVLRYARAGQSSAPAERVDMAALIRELVDLHHIGPETTVRISEDLPVLEADATQVRQVFQNLISNSLKYGRGSDPTLEITAAEVGQFYEIRVADRGPGIREEDHQRIWTLFYTTGANDDAQAGSGIGLALVKRLVERNGGSVALESKAGEGAAFIVRWPKRASQRS